MKKLLIILAMAIVSCQKEDPEPKQKVYDVTFYAYSKYTPFRVTCADGLGWRDVNTNIFTTTIQVSKYNELNNISIMKDRHTGTDNDSMYAKITIGDKVEDYGYSFHSAGRIDLQLNTPAK